MSETTILDYALLANRVKKATIGERVAGGWTCREFGEGRSWGGLFNDGFHGCIYVNDESGEIVVAFKGTGPSKVGTAQGKINILRDVHADLKLTLGIIPNQASSANRLFKRAREAYGDGPIRIVGHSLGGYLTQCVAYWHKVPFVTFNAPGAYLDLQKAKVNIFKPQVAWRSIKATGGNNEGLNFTHWGDFVGEFGMHYKKVVRLGTWNPAKHGMAHMVSTIESSQKWRDHVPF